MAFQLITCCSINGLTTTYKCVLQFVFLLEIAHALSCYQCVGTHPGCTLYDMNWYFQQVITCSRSDDRCIKVN